ncbi:MAG: Rrf2 family transcriptional regulator [Gemmatimonadetes bacterium]|nr:Rrf2 family transcriptional regulator [Gemmatimonadota bacterium]
MLSQTAEYALRAALFLARAQNRRPVTADVIARALGAPPNYMSKTLNVLAKAGILTGMRGPTGGFMLVRDPETLTVAEVVGTFDEPAQRPICLLGGRPCNADRPCQAHARWVTLTSAMREPLSSTTVADLLADVVELDHAM